MAEAAARLHDPISHSPSFGLLVAGALIGGALATLAVIAAPISAPVLIGGAMIAGGAVAGAGIGEFVGGLSFSRSTEGEIVAPGSANVFINGRPAARAHLDMVDCRQHSGGPLIAQGSDSVSINGQPAARRGDRMTCDALIENGSPNVNIGGGTRTTDPISPEVPDVVHKAMLVVGLGSAMILFGPEVAILGLAGGMIGGEVMHAVGGAIFGEGSDGQKILTFGGSLAGGVGGGKGAAWFNRNYQIRQTGLGMNGGGISITRRPVKPLEVGTYGKSAARSVGDGMSPDHIPSYASIRTSTEAQLGRSLTKAEARQLRNETNTVMIDTQIHEQASATYGGRNTPARIAQDAADLGAAARRDQAALEPALRGQGFSQKQIDAAFAKLHRANRAKGYY